MRSDMRVLLKVFGWSFALAAAVLGTAIAATLGGLSREAASYWMLGVFLAGVVAICLRFVPELIRRQPSKDKPAEPGAAPDAFAEPRGSSTRG